MESPSLLNRKLSTLSKKTIELCQINDNYEYNVHSHRVYIYLISVLVIYNLSIYTTLYDFLSLQYNICANLNTAMSPLSVIL